jgi:hypothetical protein
MRVTVGMILGLLACGRSEGEILEAYPYLELEDVREALSYVAWRLEEHEVPDDKKLSEYFRRSPLSGIDVNLDRNKSPDRGDAPL